MYPTPRVRQGMCTLVVPATKVVSILALYFPTGDEYENFKKASYFGVSHKIHEVLKSFNMFHFQGSVSHCMGRTDL